MNSLSIYLILGALILLGGLIAFGFGKLWTAEKKKSEQLKNELLDLQRSFSALTAYIREVNEINIDKEEFAEKINGAESDEEVQNIISDIIAVNNGKLSHNK